MKIEVKDNSIIDDLAFESELISLVITSKMAQNLKTSVLIMESITKISKKISIAIYAFSFTLFSLSIISIFLKNEIISEIITAMTVVLMILVSFYIGVFLGHDCSFKAAQEEDINLRKQSKRKDEKEN